MESQTEAVEEPEAEDEEEAHRRCGVEPGMAASQGTIPCPAIHQEQGKRLLLSDARLRLLCFFYHIQTEENFRTQA